MSIILLSCTINLVLVNKKFLQGTFYKEKFLFKMYGIYDDICSALNIQIIKREIFD